MILKFVKCFRILSCHFYFANLYLIMLLKPLNIFVLYSNYLNFYDYNCFTIVYY